MSVCPLHCLLFYYFMCVPGLVDAAKERQRLGKQADKLRKNIEAVTTRYFNNMCYTYFFLYNTGSSLLYYTTVFTKTSHFLVIT